MKRLFSDPEPQADLTHGVPGVQWHGNESTPGPPTGSVPTLPGVRHISADDGESFTVYVGLVAAVALFLRLVVLGMGPATGIEAAYTPSTPVELQLAQGLASELRYGVTAYPEGSRYAAVEAARAQRGERQPMADSELFADAYHAPGYPAVLSVFVKTGLDLRWLLLVQCGIAMGITLVAYRVGLVLLGRKGPALLVAALTALHPALIVAPAALSGGVIAVGLLMLGLWAVATREETPPLLASAGGLSLGLSSLFNPLLFWAAPLAALWLMLSGRRLPSLVVTTAMLIGAAAPPGLWMYRNASAGLGVTLTRAPDLERYLGVLGNLEAPATPPDIREAAMLDRLADADTPSLAGEPKTDLFSLIGIETHWRLREQGNAYLQLGNDRVLRTLVGHSANAAFTRLKLGYTPGGSTAAWLGETAPENAPATPSTATLAAGWMALNFLLLAATIAGAVALLWRRHLHQAGLLLGLSLAVLIGCVTLPGEAERLPVFVLQLMLIGGVLSPEAVRQPGVEKQSRRSRALRLQKLDTAPGPGGPLAPLGAVHASPPPANGLTGAPPAPSMLSGGTSQMGGAPPPPGRLV